MDGFKSLPKMAHFKEGGHAKKEAYCGGGKAYKKGGEVMDKEQDKAMIKKAFKQHDKAEHDKEPTEIKLRNGGRTAKKQGTVRKFKTGGSVVNTYEAKKGSGDLDNIKKTKDIKPGKADAPSGAKGGVNKYKKGGKIRKYEEGGEVIDLRSNKEGPTGIDDDVRARAKRFVETGKKDEEFETPKYKAKTKVESKKDYSDQNDRRASTFSKQEPKFRMPDSEPGLEKVYPEDYLMPSGILKGLAKGAARMGEKETAKKVMKENAAKGEEKYNQQIRNLAAQKTKKDAIKTERNERVKSSGAMKDDFKPSEMRSDYKKGGNVKKMADGGVTGALADAALLQLKSKEDRAKKYLSPMQQKELAQQQEDAYKKFNPNPPGMMPPVDQMGSAGIPAQKRGGRAGNR